jgi:zinc transport system permease protein
MMTLWHVWGYLVPALLAGIGVATVAGPLGSIMVWRRLAYFGDTLSHSGLLGVTLALALQVNVTVGVCVIAVCVALLLFKWQTQMVLASDTLLGLLSHASLALGLIALAMFQSIQVDVLGFLYGDILAVSWQDVALVYAGSMAVLIVLAKLWSALLRVTVDEDLAKVEGVSIQSVQAAYLLLLAVVVAIAIKIVGVLLITALLIIPAAGARAISKTPEQMAARASGLGIIAVILGIVSSHFWDLPTGPAIVVVSTAIFLINTLVFKNKSIG